MLNLNRQRLPLWTTLAVGLAGWYSPVSSAQGELVVSFADADIDILYGLKQSMFKAWGPRNKQVSELVPKHAEDHGY